MKSILPLFILSLILFSCSAKKKRSFSEGYVEYQIEYLSKNSKTPVSLLPRKMVVKFKDNNTLNKLESYSGVVSISMITNKEKGESSTMVKLLNKKFQYNNIDLVQQLYYDKIPDLAIEHTNDTAIIAGYKCKKAIASVSDSSNQVLDLYYTDELIFDSPNENSPFAEIEGVLLRFDMYLYGYKARFTATKIEKVKIDPKEFDVPSDYKVVNKETMQEIVSLFQ